VIRSDSLKIIVVVLSTLSFALAASQPVRAFQLDGPPVEEGIPQAETLPDDFFDFGDDLEPSWTEDIREQAGDLLLFTAFAILAMVSFFRKSEWLKWITMGASVLYLGFARSQLITIVNIFALTEWNLPTFRYNLVWYMFAIFTVVTTVLWGRLYCGRVCAFGSMTQLLDKIVPAKFRIEVPRGIDQRANYIKYGLLVATVLYFVVTGDISIYRYVEPFWMFSGVASTGMWVGLGVLLLATVFIRNLYCRFFCPVGAFLGLLSNLTVFRIKRWSECNTCKICEKACEWGAIRGPKIVASECVRCDDCERLYSDEEKCPHWLILSRKQQVKARQAQASTS
jgi:NosR/NirI family nitrous oxide reductase transcriptional regulator